MGFTGSSQITLYGRFLRGVRGTNDDNPNPVVNRVYLSPIYVPRRMLVDELCFRSTTNGGSKIIGGLYADNVDTPAGGKLLITTVAVLLSSFTFGTIKPLSITPTALSQGLYWLAAIFDNAGATFEVAPQVKALPDPFNGCFYNAATFSLVDPCPAVTVDETTSPYGSLRVNTVLE